MSKTRIVKIPDNLNCWALFTHSGTPDGTVGSFLKKVREKDRPFIRIQYFPQYRYRYIVECDLLEGLRDGLHVGFTASGISLVEQIMKRFRHRTRCVFRAGNCYVYASYWYLKDAVEVANALAELASIGGMWDKRERIPEYTTFLTSR